MNNCLPKWLTECLLRTVHAAIGAATFLFLFSFTAGRYDLDIIGLLLGSIAGLVFCSDTGDVWETMQPLFPDELVLYLESWSQDGLVAGGHMSCQKQAPAALGVRLPNDVTCLSLCLQMHTRT